MTLDDFVIAVRSYDRSDLFLTMTYKMLSENNLTDNLYIFVANEEENRKYTKSLQDKPYHTIVTAVLGLNEVTNFICDYFPPNQRIFFMDDDIKKFYFFDASGKLSSNATNLRDLLEDGFETIDQYNLGMFSFNQTTNKLFLKKKPFKELVPNLHHPMFGCRNKKSLICDLDSGGIDDYTRSVRFWETFGGILFYNWCGALNNCNKVRGGLQSTNERNVETTKHRSLYLLQKYPTFQKYCFPDIEWQPEYSKFTPKFLPPRKRKLILQQTMPQVKFLTWSGWFQKNCDS